MNQIQVGYIADQDLGPKSAYNYRNPDPDPNGYAWHKIPRSKLIPKLNFIFR